MNNSAISTTKFRTSGDSRGGQQYCYVNLWNTRMECSFEMCVGGGSAVYEAMQIPSNSLQLGKNCT